MRLPWRRQRNDDQTIIMPTIPEEGEPTVAVVPDNAKAYSLEQLLRPFHIDTTKRQAAIEVRGKNPHYATEVSRLMLMLQRLNELMSQYEQARTEAVAEIERLKSQRNTKRAELQTAFTDLQAKLQPMRADLQTKEDDLRKCLGENGIFCEPNMEAYQSALAHSSGAEFVTPDLLIEPEPLFYTPEPEPRWVKIGKWTLMILLGLIVSAGLAAVFNALDMRALRAGIGAMNPMVLVFMPIGPILLFLLGSLAEHTVKHHIFMPTLTTEQKKIVWIVSGVFVLAMFGELMLEAYGLSKLMLQDALAQARMDDKPVETVSFWLYGSIALLVSLPYVGWKTWLAIKSSNEELKVVKREQAIEEVRQENQRRKIRAAQQNREARTKVQGLLDKKRIIQDLGTEIPALESARAAITPLAEEETALKVQLAGLEGDPSLPEDTINHLSSLREQIEDLDQELYERIQG